MKKNTYQSLFRATLATTVATGALVAAVPTFTQAEVTNFKDVKKTHQFYEAIMHLTANGVINGYEDGTYKPGQQISRAHAAKIIALALDLDTVNVKDPGFKDVKKNHPYYGHIAALVNAGIIKGYEDNTFKPTGNLTRAHIAQMIVLGYKLQEEKLSNLPFKDINEKQWFSDYIQTLFSNKITSGTTATTFSPNAFVTRGQVASFLFKSEAITKVETPEVPEVQQKESTLVNITADKVEFAEGTYTLPAILKDVFSDTNLKALKGAVVKYSVLDGAIVGVSAIEIKASGTAENKLTLDGKGLTLPGNLTINGDYISLKNLTISGNLEIGKEVKNSFSAEKIKVEGKTIISDKAASTAKASYSIAAEVAPAITFTDAILAAVEITKNGSTIDFKGITTVQEISLSSNVTLKADSGIKIPKVTINKGATEVTINANVNNLVVNTTDKLTIDGSGDIGTLDIKSADAKITLGANINIDNLVLPAGVVAKDLIENFDAIKGNIDNIGGTTPVTPVNPGTGGGGGTVTPPTAEAVFESAVQNKLAEVTINPAVAGAKIEFLPSTNTLNVAILDSSKSSTALAGTGLVDAFTGVSGVSAASISAIKEQLSTLVKNNKTLEDLYVNGPIVINLTLTNDQKLTYTINFTK